MKPESSTALLNRLQAAAPATVPAGPVPVASLLGLSPKGLQSLTADQQQALDHLLDAVARKESSSLIGPAGSGKTFLTGRLAQILLDQGLQLLCAAPTHKACGVLRHKIPAGVEVITVASLLGLKPVMKGRHIHFTADWDQAKKRARLSGVDVLLVDESSMVSQATATLLVALAKQYGTVVVFVGDAAQLPPVDPPVDPEAGDGTEGRGHMAAEFLSPPGGPAVLTEVVRHGGPVLDLATAIRGCSTTEEISKAWPAESQVDPCGRVVVWPDYKGWIDSACQILSDPRWQGDPDAGRIVCWTNRAVASITRSVRARVYGSAASHQWQVGEIVANGDAVQQQGQSLAKPLAPSSCEWRIEDAEVIQFAVEIDRIPWTTPAKGLARELVVGASLPMQRLLLVPLAAGAHQAPITVLAPMPGDTAWRDRISSVKRGVLAIPADQARARKAGWRAWHQLRSHVCDLRSAAVLTVHRAQGSTFRQVWIHQDMQWAQGPEAVPLLYTALTRASRSVHLLGRAEAGEAAAA